MNRIIKVYLKNIFTQKAFYVCLGINCILILIGFITTFFIKSNEVHTAWKEMLEIFTGGVDVAMIIFITLFVCSDFTDGAAKNYIARGYTRRQLLTSKFIVSLIAIAVFYVVEALFAFALYAKNGIGFEAGNLLYILGLLVASVATVGLFVVIANTVEKLGTAMMINIILPTMTGMLFPLLSKLINFDISSYWITGLPGLMSNVPTIGEFFLVIGIALVYLILLFELSNYIIKKKEVK